MTTRLSIFRKDRHEDEKDTMKKLLALALAVVTASAMVACTTAPEETTPATTTTAAPATTTAKPDTKPTTEPETEPAGPVAETPATGLAIADIFAKGKNLQTLVTDVAATGINPWGDGAPANAFDGNTTGTKIGGGVTGTVDITWKTSSETTVNAYAVYTGGDSAKYGRLPYSWEFFGSTDGETWTSIDKVEISGVTLADSTPFGYTVDTPAAYSFYKFSVTAVSSNGTAPGGDALQMNEIVLIGSGEGTTAETPVTDTAEIDALIAGGNLTANVKDPATGEGFSPWGDGPATNLFDGDTTGTKIGGGGNGPVSITWTTDVATTVKNYVIYTGGDDADWGRTPSSWVLFGSTDGENWTIIDYVSESGMPNANATPFGFSVDSPAAYTSYTLVIMTALGTDGNTYVPGSIQMNELVLIGDAAVAETPAE